MITHIQTLYTYTAERRFIWMLCGVLCAALFLYILLVGLTIFTVAAHNTLSKDVQTIDAHISGLEAQYITLNNTISREYAETLGFHEPLKETFAFRKRLVQSGL